MLEQFILNGIIAGATYTLLGISFGLIYFPTRFFNLAHGALYTIGAYGTLMAMQRFAFPLPFAAIIGVSISVLVGVTLELLIFRKLRIKNSSSLVLLLVSFGLYIMLQNCVSLVFGDYIHTIRSEYVLKGLQIGEARITPAQIAIIIASIFFTVTLAVILKRTNLGIIIRAVGEDSELSAICGVDVDKFILYTFAIGSALAGVAGILWALDYDLSPTMGLNALLTGLVAVIIGGMNSLVGIAMGALLIGFAQQTAVWVLGAQWQEAIVFAILLGFLILRPEGFIGRKTNHLSTD